MRTIINNNLWSPIPWGWNHNSHCNCNNWFNKIFGYQMLFGMFNSMSKMTKAINTPQTQSFYPDVNFSFYNTQLQNQKLQQQEYIQKLEDQRSLQELKSAWSEFKISKIGDKYYAILANDKTQQLEANSVEDLMDKINEYAKVNPDRFDGKSNKDSIKLTFEDLQNVWGINFHLIDGGNIYYASLKENPEINFESRSINDLNYQISKYYTTHLKHNNEE